MIFTTFTFTTNEITAMAFEFLNSLINAPAFDDEEDEFNDERTTEESISDESDIDVDPRELDLEDEVGERRSSSRSSSNELNGATATSQTDETGWSEDLHDVFVDPFEEAVGVLIDITDDTKPIDVFEMIFTPNLYEMIATETNKYAEQKQRENNKIDKEWKPVTVCEIQRFLYINIMFGIHQLPELRMYWSSDKMLQVDAVADVLSRNRYLKINQYLHVNDRTQQIQRGQPGYDPLFKVRPILDIIRQRSKELYKPSRAISIDEAMVAYNGRLHFKQYIPSKPHPYGIKVWCAAESKTGYLLNFSVYCGKAEEDMPNGLGHHVVMNVAADYLNKCHVFYFDNFFSSLKLAETLLANKTYCCGTIRKNRQGWPLSKEKEKKGTLAVMQKNNLVATKWVDKREVNMLSTNCNPGLTTVSRRTKAGITETAIPTPVADYNINMGGVDLADQLRASYQIGRESKKWWRYMFWFLIQTAMINSFLILKSERPNAKRGTPASKHLAFRISVLKSLLERSMSTHVRKPAETPSVAATISINDSGIRHQNTRLDGRKKRCFQCAADGKKTPKGRTPETVHGCRVCGIHLCQGHCHSKFHKLL